MDSNGIKALLRQATASGFSSNDVTRLGYEVAIEYHRDRERGKVKPVPRLSTAEVRSIKEHLLDGEGHLYPNEAVLDLLAALKIENGELVWEALLHIAKAQLRAQPHLRMDAGLL